MTREEAIAELSVLHERLSNPKDCEDGCYSWEDGWYVEAIDMAIEALSADAEQGVGRYEKAMQKLREMPSYINGVKAKQIKKIPSDAVHGEWHQISPARIYECSICNHNVLTDYIDTYNYCPNCGARMKGGAE